jgi:hypothetical protein
LPSPHHDNSIHNPLSITYDAKPSTSPPSPNSAPQAPQERPPLDEDRGDGHVGEGRLKQEVRGGGSWTAELEGGLNVLHTGHMHRRKEVCLGWSRTCMSGYGRMASARDSPLVWIVRKCRFERAFLGSTECQVKQWYRMPEGSHPSKLKLLGVDSVLCACLQSPSANAPVLSRSPVLFPCGGGPSTSSVVILPTTSILYMIHSINLIAEVSHVSYIHTSKALAIYLQEHLHSSANVSA